MRLKWEESDPLLIGFCALASFMFAGTWGGLLWIFFPAWGLKVGAVLFLPCFVILYNTGRRYDPEKEREDDEYYG